jgi:hypothetical protein
LTISAASPPRAWRNNVRSGRSGGEIQGFKAINSPTRGLPVCEWYVNNPDSGLSSGGVRPNGAADMTRARRGFASWSAAAWRAERRVAREGLPWAGACFASTPHAGLPPYWGRGRMAAGLHRGSRLVRLGQRSRISHTRDPRFRHCRAAPRRPERRAPTAPSPRHRRRVACRLRRGEPFGAGRPLAAPGAGGCRPSDGRHRSVRVRAGRCVSALGAGDPVECGRAGRRAIQPIA